MFDVIIVGAGPAGLGILSSIYRLPNSSSKQTLKICIIDEAHGHNVGKLGDYTISSDTRAEKFLTCLDGLPHHILSEPELTRLTKRLESYAVNAAPLIEVGAFYRALSRAIHQDMIAKRQLEFKDQTKVLSAQRESEYWQVKVRSKEGERSLKTKHLVLACGATELKENADRFLQTQNITRNQLKKFALSSDVLKAADDDPILKHLETLESPKVVILGGSHSAISVANKLLSHNIPFETSGISLFHRSPLYVTFKNAADARKRGFTDFDLDDICPHTNRVYALKGFRLDAAKLLMAIQGYDDGPLEKRVTLSRLQDWGKAALQQALLEADLVISALGYTPDYPQLYDEQKIKLNSPNFVNEHSQLLNADETIIPNCYALGLASNYKLAGRFGEPSFMGQANGLVLWHKDIGMDIVSSIIGGQSCGDSDTKIR